MWFLILSEPLSRINSQESDMLIDLWNTSETNYLVLSATHGGIPGSPFGPEPTVASGGRVDIIIGRPKGWYRETKVFRSQWLSVASSFSLATEPPVRRDYIPFLSFLSRVSLSWLSLFFILSEYASLSLSFSRTVTSFRKTSFPPQGKIDTWLILFLECTEIENNYLRKSRVTVKQMNIIFGDFATITTYSSTGTSDKSARIFFIFIKRSANLRDVQFVSSCRLVPENICILCIREYWSVFYESCVTCVIISSLGKYKITSSLNFIKTPVPNIFLRAKLYTT